jgi:SAM-dependent methyltransferase
MFNDYSGSAHIYDDFLQKHLDYRAACTKLHEVIKRHHPGASKLLDVGCGTGKHLELLQHHYEAEGIDISPEMLKKARKRCPDVTFYTGSMDDFALQKKYDVITCLYAVIAFMPSLEKVYQAVACMVKHLNDGGILLIEPWWSPNQLWEGKLIADFTDMPELKIANMYVIRREGRTSIIDMHYMVGTPLGIETFVQREALLLLTREEYTKAFESAGLLVEYYDTDLFPGHQYGLYVGKKNDTQRGDITEYY